MQFKLRSAIRFNLDQFKILSSGNGLTKQALAFMCLQCDYFENTVGKGEIARNEQFLFFPQRFLPFKIFLPVSLNLKLSSANCFILEESKICGLAKG